MRVPSIKLTLGAAAAALALGLAPSSCSDPSEGSPPERPARGDDVSERDAAGVDTPLDVAVDPTDDTPALPDVATDAPVDPPSGDTAVADTSADVVEDAAEDTSEDASADAADPDAAVDAAVDTPPDTGPTDDLTVLGPPGAGELETVRFILMGDTGEGNAAQYQVSESAARHCDERGGCHALLLLGDNIYDEGPSSPDDPLLTEYIDAPYANLRYGEPPADGAEDTRPRLPILASLGNHDLGGAGLDASLAQHFIDWGRDKEWFYFPSRTWNGRFGPVAMAVLDTNPLAYLGTELAEQGALVTEVTESGVRWKIVFGHHPYRSNGDHGNAGSYEGIPGDLVFLGGRFREFVDEYICNQADFYFCGHEHNRQWMRSVPRIPSWPIFPPPPVTFACATGFAVSGAGAKDDNLVDRGNDLAFGSEFEGFLYMEFGPDEATAEFAAADGTVEWTQTFR